MQNIPITDARNLLPRIIHKVEAGEVAQFTRRGKPVAVLLSSAEYQALQALKEGDLWQILSVYRDQMEDAEEPLTDEMVDSWRDRSEGRALPWD